MSETHRIKFLHGVFNRMHPHAVFAVVSLIVIVGGALAGLYILQNQLSTKLESCKEAFLNYKTLTETTLNDLNAAVKQQSHEVKTMRYESNESKGVLRKLEAKFLPKTAP
jgi:flagellar motor component MotA